MLTGSGYDGDAHRARQFDPQWFEERDLVIALDRGHARALRSWAPEDARDKVRLLRSFDPDASGDEADLDVADPYYDGPEEFRAVLGRWSGVPRAAGAGREGVAGRQGVTAMLE